MNRIMQFFSVDVWVALFLSPADTIIPDLAVTTGPASCVCHTVGVGLLVFTVYQQIIFEHLLEYPLFSYSYSFYERVGQEDALLQCNISYHMCDLVQILTPNPCLTSPLIR